MPDGAIKIPQTPLEMVAYRAILFWIEQNKEGGNFPLVGAAADQYIDLSIDIRALARAMGIDAEKLSDERFEIELYLICTAIREQWEKRTWLENRETDRII